MYVFPENTYANSEDKYSEDAIELLNIFIHMPCDLGQQKFKY